MLTPQPTFYSTNDSPHDANDHPCWRRVFPYNSWVGLVCHRNIRRGGCDGSQIINLIVWLWTVEDQTWMKSEKHRKEIDPVFLFFLYRTILYKLENISLGECICNCRGVWSKVQAIWIQVGHTFDTKVLLHVTFINWCTSRQTTFYHPYIKLRSQARFRRHSDTSLYLIGGCSHWPVYGRFTTYGICARDISRNHKNPNILFI